MARPNIVQAVRSVDDSAIASDLTWRGSQRETNCVDYYSKTATMPPWIYNQ